MYQNYDYAPKNKKKINAWRGKKHLESTKTKITDDKNMMKVVLQHKQICIMHQKYHGEITKNMKSPVWEIFG